MPGLVKNGHYHPALGVQSSLFRAGHYTALFASAVCALYAKLATTPPQQSPVVTSTRTRA